MALDLRYKLVFALYLWHFFTDFLQTLCESILGKSVLGLQMCKFRQIFTELWPLIYIRNWFSLSIFDISLPIFFKLCMRVDIGKECLEIEDG